jgi:hypothetical protein
MDRLEFLDKAENIAHGAVSDSTAMTDEEFDNLESTDETALYQKAKQILDEAVFSIEFSISEM